MNGEQKVTPTVENTGINIPNFGMQRMLEAHLSNNPYESKAPTLAEIQTLNQLAKIGSQTDRDNFNWLAESQMVYLAEATKALKINPKLREKFGNSLSSALVVSNILQQERSRAEFQKMFESHALGNITTRYGKLNPNPPPQNP